MEGVMAIYGARTIGAIRRDLISVIQVEESKSICTEQGEEGHIGPTFHVTAYLEKVGVTLYRTHHLETAKGAAALAIKSWVTAKPVFDWLGLEESYESVTQHG